MTGLVDTAEQDTATRTGVPWVSVLALAVVLAYADGFWAVALRGAVGSVERTDAPFTTWLQESTLLLPVYVFAVLAALTLALRWFGPHPRRASAAATTLLLVVAAATLAAIAVLVANAAYDYQLQGAHLGGADGHGTCDAACLAVKQQAALNLQVRAVGFGSLLVLASNLVLVVLVVAMRGRRLELTSPPRRAVARRRDDLTLFLAAGLFGAAAIHAAVVPEHAEEWTAAGMFFVILGAAELAVAAAVLLSGRPVVLLAAAALSAGPLLLWAYSRTRGLPFGPEAGVPEGIGPADVAASLLEAATLAVALLCLRSPVRRTGASRHVGRLALVGVVAVTVIGLAGDLTLVSEAGHHDEVTARG